MRIEKICQFCSSEYLARVTPSRPASRSKYCSRICGNRAITERRKKKSQIKRICKICDNEYIVNKSDQKKCCSPKCANKLRGIASRKRDSKITVQCVTCGCDIKRPPSRVDGRKHSCSYECWYKYMETNPIRPATEYKIVQCANCGKDIKKFNSRINQYSNNFCNQACYLSHSGTSSIEKAVKEWLTENNIPFDHQVKLGKYTIDFLINESLCVEVNGCYWHGCTEHFSNPSRRIKRRIKRDTKLAKYCEDHNISLIFIWEHDIVKNDFSTIESAIL